MARAFCSSYQKPFCKEQYFARYFGIYQSLTDLSHGKYLTAAPQSYPVLPKGRGVWWLPEKLCKGHSLGTGSLKTENTLPPSTSPPCTAAGLLHSNRLQLKGPQASDLIEKVSRKTQRQKRRKNNNNNKTKTQGKFYPLIPTISAKNKHR